MSLKENLVGLYSSLPYWLQDGLITVFNTYQYRQRQGGDYAKWKAYHAQHWTADQASVEQEAMRRQHEFLSHATTQSRWFSKHRSSDLQSFPTMTKQDLVANRETISTLEPNKGVVGKTGGTTGASLEVVYDRSDFQERMALLDLFREQFGHSLGKKTSWFSGKSIVTERDVVKGRCYRDDLINKIRFFSTFHINSGTIGAYAAAHNRFSPEYIVGFPSSIFEMCRLAKEHGIQLNRSVKAVFPTSEVVYPHQRTLFREMLGAETYDQYASAEGAPFIVECAHRNLHFISLSGAIEIVDEDLEPIDEGEGEALVTSFTTRGTPLIRYRVGDRMKFSDANKTCPCGSPYPLVDYIDGRTAAHITSPETGNIYQGNLSNCTKGVSGIECFQLVQNTTNAVTVRLVADRKFDTTNKAKFLENLRERTGDLMQVDIEIVNHIPPGKNGKFRFVINNL
ncbi:MAG: phenylacetate--CoA ligase family protein [Pseudomonadota bacterium]